MGALIGGIVSIPGSEEDESKADKVVPLACVNNTGTLVASYRGKLHFHIYQLKDQETYLRKDTINLRKEIIANGNSDFPYTPQRDSVRKIRFIYNGD